MTHFHQELSNQDIASLRIAKSKGSVAFEATALIHSIKADEYGDAVENHDRIAKIANAIKTEDDTNTYTAANVAIVLLAVKLARMQYQFKRDSYVDAIGYTDILYRIKSRDNAMSGEPQ